MNVDTLELHEDRVEAIKDLMNQGQSENEASEKLIPLSNREYTELTGMNRKARRAFAKMNRKRSKRH